jgi:hypothetical protein
MTGNQLPSNVAATAEQINDDVPVDIDKTDYSWFVQVECQLGDLEKAFGSKATLQTQESALGLVTCMCCQEKQSIDSE